MVVTHVGEKKQMEYKISTLKTKLQDLDETIINMNIQHSSMNNRRQPDYSTETGFSSSSNFCGPNIDFFLSSMLMIQLDGYIGKNNIAVCIKILMSTKSHLHPFIWSMNPLNGSIGTSRLMNNQNGNIFFNFFCNDLSLVLLITSQEHSLKFPKLAV